MLDPTRIRSELDAAISAFVSETMALFDGLEPRKPVRIPTPNRKNRHIGQSTQKAAPIEQTPRAETKEGELQGPIRIRLIDRPNIIRVPSGASLPSLPIPEQAKSAERTNTEPLGESHNKGPTPEEIASGASKAVLASDVALTFEQIRLRLRVSRSALAPVLDQLVADNKMRALEVDGTVTYKPPRIEPIRRRRPAA